MIARLLTIGVLAATGAMAGEYVTRAWFPDGAEVQLRTQTTGGTQQAASGGGGVTPDNQMFRIVQDSQYKIVFSYELEARKAPGSDAVSIRIKPFTVKGPTRTVSGVRDFPAVKLGEEVKIEILSNPATGEKVYDVIRPADEPSPSPGSTLVRCSVTEEGSSVKFTVNGKAQWLENSWTTGKPARLYLPGQGAYYLSWESRPKFRLAGYKQGDRLIFLFDGQYVEMTFDRSVPTAPESGPVWIYHDPNFVGQHNTAELDVPDLEALHAK